LLQSFDHLVGGDKQARRHGQVERLRSLEIEDRLVLGRRLHRKLRGRAAAQNAIDIGRCLPELVHEVDSVGHEATSRDELPPCIHGRQAVPRRQRDDEVTMGTGGRIRRKDQTAVWQTRKGLNDAPDVASVPDGPHG